MSNDELKIELEILKRQKVDLEKKIEKLEKKINPLDTDDWDVNSYSESGFKQYLVEIKKVNERTIKKYFGYLNSLKKRLKKYAGLNLSKPIYQIVDIKELEKIKGLLSSNLEIIEDNKRLHNVFTASFNNYYEYIKNHYRCAKTRIVSSEFVLDE